jgi:hypothetical protein
MVNGRCGAAPWYLTNWWLSGYQGPNFWTVKGLIFLTTPVAYLTQAPDDPFSSSSPYAGPFWPGFWWDNCIDRRDYHMDPNAGIINPATDKVASVDGRTRFDWMVYSFGPDRDTNSRFNADGTHNQSGSGGVIPMYTPYDPTNGTVSIGDIFRVGVVRANGAQ